MTTRKPLRLGFDLPFEAAIAAARARKVDVPEDYYRRAPGEARRAATTISGLAAIDQIQAVIDSLDQAVAGGASFEQWRKAAQGKSWGLSRGRMETIFRTNVQTAYAQGHWREFRRSKARRPYLMWSAINDSRVRPAHLAMDGHIAPIDDPIWEIWHPPAGYNSLLPWQRVSGNAFVGLKAWYSGPVVEIRGQTGARLSVTAQHPVLTARGWVAAKNVKRGDQLVGYRGPVRGRSVAAHLNEDDTPPTIEQVFDALALRARGAMPRSALYLYGDVEFLDGDVEVVASDRELLRAIEAERAQRFDHRQLALANHLKRALACARRLLVVSRRELGGFARTPGDLDAGFGRAAVADVMSGGFQVLGQMLAIESMSFRDLPYGHSRSVERLNIARDRLSWARWCAAHLATRDKGRGLRFGPLGGTRFADVFVGGLEVNPNALRDVLHAHPGAVELDDVVDVSARNWTGHVYDLETASGNILAYGEAGGLHYILSNCRCSQISLTEEQAQTRGYGRQLPPAVTPDPGFSEVEPGNVASALRRVIAKRIEQCEVEPAFSAGEAFARTWRRKPFWCMDDKRWTIERVERSTEDRTRRVQARDFTTPDGVVEITYFANAAWNKRPTPEPTLALGPVENAAAIFDATRVALIGEYVHVLDWYGVRHANRHHGDRAIEESRNPPQRGVTSFDFLVVPHILAAPDRIVYAGKTRHLKLDILRFVKRIGDEEFSYSVEVRAGRGQLATLTLWVRPVGR